MTSKEEKYWKDKIKSWKENPLPLFKSKEQWKTAAVIGFCLAFLGWFILLGEYIVGVLNA